MTPFSVVHIHKMNTSTQSRQSPLIAACKLSVSERSLVRREETIVSRCSSVSGLLRTDKSFTKSWHVQNSHTTFLSQKLQGWTTCFGSDVRSSLTTPNQLRNCDAMRKQRSYNSHWAYVASGRWLRGLVNITSICLLPGSPPRLT